MISWSERSEFEELINRKIRETFVVLQRQQAKDKSPEEQAKAREEVEPLRRQLDVHSKYLEQLRKSPLTVLYPGMEGQEELKSIIEKIIEKVAQNVVEERVKEYLEKEEDKKTGIPEVVKKLRRNRYLAVGAALFAAFSAAGAAVYIAYKTRTAEIVNASNISSRFESYKTDNDNKIKILEESQRTDLDTKISGLESRIEDKIVQRENSLRKGLEVQINVFNTDITALKLDTASTKEINVRLKEEQESLRAYFSEIKTQLSSAEKEYSLMAKKEDLSKELLPLTNQLNELKTRMDAYGETLGKINIDSNSNNELYKTIKSDFEGLKKEFKDANFRMENFMLRYDSKGLGEQ